MGPPTPGIIPPQMPGGGDSQFQFNVQDPFARGARFREQKSTITQESEDEPRNIEIPPFHRRTTQTRYLFYQIHLLDVIHYVRSPVSHIHIEALYYLQ